LQQGGKALDAIEQGIRQCENDPTERSVGYGGRPDRDGHVTLELANLANLPMTLYPGMKIGQISFIKMTSPAEKPYGSGAKGSKYQGQRGPTPSRYFENFQ
jgi:deoxycytidine triphosphate deaminase